MDNASKKFEKYIDFWVNFRPSVADKILYNIFRGLESPPVLRAKLKIAKGNLANYCKRLVRDGKLTQHTLGKAVKYELTEKGKARVREIMEAANATL